MKEANPKKILFSFSVFLFFFSVLFLGLAFAQTTLVTINGTIKDEQGNALPGVKVNVKNAETGYIYSGTTRPDGQYLISGIQPGKYEIEVSLSGFKAEKRQGLTFNLGARLTIDFTLPPTAVEEEVTVTAPSPIVEVTKSEVSSVVDRQKIEDLPLLDRNFASLIILKAGVQQEEGSNAIAQDQRSNAMPRGNEEYLLDGVSNEWVGNNVQRISIPADAIQEFRVLTNQYQAEYGNASGMVMSAITRSGTNQFRGRASFFYRDQAFDAVNYFVNHASYNSPELSEDQYKKPRFDHYNYAGFIGGPIKKDKAHFFLAYEGLSHNEYAAITSPLVPNETVKQPSNTNQVLAKLNYQLNEKNLLTFRYTLNRVDSDNLGVGGLFTKEWAYRILNTTQDFQANWTLFPSDKTMNEFRVLYSRTVYDVTVPDKNRYSVQRPSGYFGKPTNFPQISYENRYQFMDNFNLFLGNHNVKLGFDLARVPIHGDIWQYKPGFFIFTTDAPFDPADFATYPLLLFYNTGDTTFNTPYTEGGIFAQDSWRIHSRLTLNLGLRYNFFSCKGLHVKNSDIRNLNPRIGFSWDPVGDGKTAIRGGIGTFSSNPMLNLGLLAQFMNQLKIQTLIFPNYPDPTKPNPFFPSIPGALSLGEYGAMENQIAPYTLQATLGVERAFLTDLSVAADLIWTKGIHLSRFDQYNPVIPGTYYLRQDMTKGDVWIITDKGKSDYKALYLTCNKRYSHGWALEVSYTLSQSKADVEYEQTMPDSYEPDAWEKQYGPTDRDARHRLAVTGIVDLPLGFQLSAFFYYRSALPWNAIYADDKNADSLVSDYVDTYRNSRRGFDMSYLNARISKYFTFDRFRLQLFGEFYNVTNRNNFRDVFNIEGSPNFGQPTVAGTPRLLQLGVRFDF
jgi:hypothetical protein